MPRPRSNRALVRNLERRIQEHCLKMTRLSRQTVLRRGVTPEAYDEAREAQAHLMVALAEVREALGVGRM